MRILDLPNFNKPSSKLKKYGASKLGTDELLAIIFGKGGHGESAIDISNRVLKKYNLSGIEELGFSELLKFLKGSRGKADTADYVRAMKLFSLIELSKRYNRLVNHGYKRKITNAKDVYDYLDSYGKLKKEYFLCLYLNTKNIIIKDEVISIGTLNASLVHPREVFKTAIKESANSIILVHNHPSGDSTPSKQDFEVTKALMKAGGTLDIPVVDHVIIGSEKYYSFKERAKEI